MNHPLSRASIFAHRSAIVMLALPLLGVALIALSQRFHFVQFQIEWERVLAEVGALIMVVGVLHWLFELGLRDAMLREVAETVSGSALLHVSGVETCSLDSKKVEDQLHWAQCTHLLVGRQYSTRFLKDFHDVLRRRCNSGLPTTIFALNANGPGAEYLSRSNTGTDIAGSLKEALDLISQYDCGKKKHIRVLQHDVVMRYAFIQTSECIWVIFYTNGPGRATVPALKIRAGTDMYSFFDRDIKNLLEHSHEAR